MIRRRYERRSVAEELDIDGAAHERLALLELATELEHWPVRNVVVRIALDNAAEHLTRLAVAAPASVPPCLSPDYYSGAPTLGVERSCEPVQP